MPGYVRERKARGSFFHGRKQYGCCFLSMEFINSSSFLSWSKQYFGLFAHEKTFNRPSPSHTMSASLVNARVNGDIRGPEYYVSAVYE